MLAQLHVLRLLVVGVVSIALLCLGLCCFVELVVVLTCRPRKELVLKYRDRLQQEKRKDNEAA